MKINSNYMLGLSATPNRKDGLTKVFEYHIGKICHSEKRQNLNLIERLCDFKT
jgi:superfamily II DNA or RNA helicase